MGHRQCRAAQAGLSTVTVPVVKVVAWAVVLAVLGWGELAHWRASRRRLGARSPGDGTREAVVVLGYRNRGARANAVNRWRVRAGLRSVEGTAVLVLSGGAVAGRRPEAALMAAYARDECGYLGPIAVDDQSRSTWQNVANVIPLIEDADRIKIVSHSLHAEKAREYLWRQRPDLGAHLVRGQDYRLGEWLFVKPALAVVGLRNLRRLAAADH